MRGSDLTKVIQPERKLACNHNGLEAAKRALQPEPATMNNGLINPANTANIEEVLFKKISSSTQAGNFLWPAETSFLRFSGLIVFLLVPCMQVSVLSNWTSHDHSPSPSFQLACNHSSCFVVKSSKNIFSVILLQIITLVSKNQDKSHDKKKEAPWS